MQSETTSSSILSPLTSPPLLLYLFATVVSLLLNADGQYEYGRQLLELEACAGERSVVLLDYLRKVVTPIKLDARAEALSTHPDQIFADYIQRCISQGFRIGFNPALASVQSSKANLASAMQQAEVVDKYLQEELAANKIIQVQEGDAALIHCSPSGVIPKRNRPNKWRFILDLSSPAGHSVNDGISKDLARLLYISVDDVVEGIIAAGQGYTIGKDGHQTGVQKCPHLLKRQNPAGHAVGSLRSSNFHLEKRGKV